MHNTIAASDLDVHPTCNLYFAYNAVVQMYATLCHNATQKYLKQEPNSDCWQSAEIRGVKRCLILQEVMHATHMHKT
jgi:hypothetical protein